MSEETKPPKPYTRSAAAAAAPTSTAPVAGSQSETTPRELPRYDAAAATAQYTRGLAAFFAVINAQDQEMYGGPAPRWLPARPPAQPALAQRPPAPPAPPALLTPPAPRTLQPLPAQSQ